MNILKPFTMVYIAIGLLLTQGCGAFIDPVLVKSTDNIEGVKIQPSKALEMAKPHIATHATYEWKKDKPMQTTIVKHRKYYYIMQTNYPAKSLRYYMQPAVRIHVNSGEMTFVEKK